MAVAALSGLYSTITFDAARMQNAADSSFSAATDLAELLVSRGMPFREAHAIVGSIVRNAMDRHVDLAELVENHPALGPKALALLEPGVSVQRRTSPGGAGPKPFVLQLERFRALLDRDGLRLPS